ncbi:uracil-DNA glycosylase [Daejeonella sp.]|uniref:uracil-DNA glycosylase n=1 Tax=Daejeonella sp. TaxID=2805397 RepID=UPI0025BB64F7|nr:uracil-DNA glycosylase [Daejeonella sp.]
MEFQIESSWKLILKDEFEKDYMKKLAHFIQEKYDKEIQISPPKQLIFNAFKHTPFEKVKVVILGQDPYHGLNQANGLAFSVNKEVAIPPSLKNIFKELQSEYPEFRYPTHGDLSSWADQGVLLLNATLTVEESLAGSHQNQGWEQFTDRVIQVLSEKRTGIIFLLWGKYAQAKAHLIDSKKHVILTAPHPSPLSVYQGFLGCKHFIKTNEILKKAGITPINWQLS